MRALCQGMTGYRGTLQGRGRVPQNAQKRSRALAPAHFEPLVVSRSTTSALRKQLFFQIPTQTLSNAIALQVTVALIDTEHNADNSLVHGVPPQSCRKVTRIFG